MLKAVASGMFLEAIMNFNQLHLLCIVQAGNGQTFSDVLIDTGSAILWLGGETPYEPGPNTQAYVVKPTCLFSLRV